MTRPPRICERLLEQAVPPQHREAILGDLAEEFVSRSATNWWYCKEAFMVLLHTRVTRIFIAVGLNIAAFAIFWMLGFAGNRLFEGAPLARLVEPVATAAGVLIALRLRAKPMAFFLAAMLAFALAEFIAHSIGFHAIRGAQIHFTVMGAGLFGVIFGAGLVRYLAGRDATKMGATKIVAT
ncbi:MAG TPA: hypothetical protein VE974_12580 [Thermoanaerobaculia bacterium]|nr:hypothetical protein [Thermoanaerobaculia bacterium]